MAEQRDFSLKFSRYNNSNSRGRRPRGERSTSGPRSPPDRRPAGLSNNNRKIVPWEKKTVSEGPVHECNKKLTVLHYQQQEGNSLTKMKNKD